MRTTPVCSFRVLFLLQLNAELHLSDRIHISILLSRVQHVYKIWCITISEGVGIMQDDKTGLAKTEMHFEQVDGMG